MAPNLSKYLTRNNALAASSIAVTLWLVYKQNHATKAKASNKSVAKREKEEIQYMISEKGTPRKKRAQVDALFFHHLWQLFKIGVPGVFTVEVGYMILVALSLVGRTGCDLWMIHSLSKIEHAIVCMDKSRFMTTLAEYAVYLPVISVINNMLKFTVGELKIRLRANVTRRLYDDYLRKFTYYHMSNLDNRVANADQLLTTDIDKFCESVAELYCNTSKPILDILLYIFKLNTNMGFGTIGLMCGYLIFAGVFLTYLRKPVSYFTSNEQKLEGEFRHVNARIITYSEEIAFYHGNEKEKLTVLTSFNKLMGHIRKFLRFQIVMGFVENIVAKYFAISVGFLSMSIPFMSDREDLRRLHVADRSKFYYENGTMIVRLGQAIGRLILAGRELSKLAGYTSRVTELRKVINDLNEGKYQRDMVPGSESLKPYSGHIIFQNNTIKFDQVPVVTPNGDILIKELSVEIKSGMNVLVCGPNGAGKSSVFRILGELWPLFGGTLTKPPRGKLFYIPQKPYMTLGSLRDQITYPHCGSEALRRGVTDEQLENHLKMVQLEYLVDREGGLDAVADWLEILSGGEKQRIAMARLFYHAPEFAILDECTSAVSLDVEESMYSYCKEVGITLLTVSHRKSLWQHHEYALYLDGRGGYSFKPIEEYSEQFGS
uniref:ABC transporter domain-containing protein n=1 Tax=Photinus pyralis TaxID=7054 RepID=A0A1Y1M2Q2_PHOPY